MENYENKPIEEAPRESYVPKMKPGDVEIPNRVFVKGFPRDATADDLFSFFEEYGKVLECRIVADHNGASRGYGFITFDSQNIAEQVKGMERIKYDDEIELAIGPARIRKKRYYLLPTPQYQQPQPYNAYYAPDGCMYLTSCLPQQQVMQTPLPVQVVTSSQNYGQPVSQQSYGTPPQTTTYVTPVSQNYGTPMQQTYTASPVQQQTYTTSPPVQNTYGTPMQQNYGTPVVLSMVTADSPQQQQSNNQSTCVYQAASPQAMNNLVEKVSSLAISPTPMTDDAVVPTMTPSQTYVDIQPNGQETIVYNPVVSFVPQQRHV